jgi:hypothetical protein
LSTKSFDSKFQVPCVKTGPFTLCSKTGPFALCSATHNRGSLTFLDRRQSVGRIAVGDVARSKAFNSNSSDWSIHAVLLWLWLSPTCLSHTTTTRHTQFTLCSFDCGCHPHAKATPPPHGTLVHLTLRRRLKLKPITHRTPSSLSQCLQDSCDVARLPVCVGSLVVPVRLLELQRTKLLYA